ncbi:iron-sulfur cluster biosynthesis family protein [Companilactobacillus metriopterae]|uniref:iron-sulfur cluster biosynthesis family protein n=1 Tax=Companilactobacillus metriopterae TaxID=1909267 RepID=UPI0013E99970|nr:iron-sulfur cluster biosynthesis family protein [Companilactobacillus metriopterae]
MKINISEEAKTKLAKYGDDKNILIDLDDGFGKFSGTGDCALITKFRVIIVDKNEDLTDYPIELDSDLGTIYFKSTASDFLKSDLKLEVNLKNQLLVLKSDFETLDNAVNIVDIAAVK